MSIQTRESRRMIRAWNRFTLYSNNAIFRRDIGHFESARDWAKLARRVFIRYTIRADIAEMEIERKEAIESRNLELYNICGAAIEFLHGELAKRKPEESHSDSWYDDGYNAHP